MKYDLVYTRRAVKDIEGLDHKIKDRIGKTLLRYKVDPLRYAERLTDSSLTLTPFLTPFSTLRKLMVPKGGVEPPCPCEH